MTDSIIKLTQEQYAEIAALVAADGLFKFHSEPPSSPAPIRKDALSLFDTPLWWFREAIEARDAEGLHPFRQSLRETICEIIDEAVDDALAEEHTALPDGTSVAFIHPAGESTLPLFPAERDTARPERGERQEVVVTRGGNKLSFLVSGDGARNPPDRLTSLLLLRIAVKHLKEQSEKRSDIPACDCKEDDDAFTLLKAGGATFRANRVRALEEIVAAHYGLLGVYPGIEGVGNVGLAFRYAKDLLEYERGGMPKAPENADEFQGRGRSHPLPGTPLFGILQRMNQKGRISLWVSNPCGPIARFDTADNGRTLVLPHGWSKLNEPQCNYLVAQAHGVLNHLSKLEPDEVE